MHFHTGEGLVRGTDEDRARLGTHEDNIERTQGAREHGTGFSADVRYRIPSAERVVLDDAVRSGVILAVPRLGFRRSSYAYGTYGS